MGHACAADAAQPSPLWGGSRAKRAGWGSLLHIQPHPASLGYRLRSATLPTRGRECVCLALKAHHRLRCAEDVNHRPGFLTAPGRRPSLSSPGTSPRGGAPGGAQTFSPRLVGGMCVSGEDTRASRRSTAALSGPGPRFSAAFPPPISQLLAGGSSLTSGRSPGPPGGAVTNRAGRKPHPAPPARRLMMTPSDERGENSPSLK
jgi:hypothetical protein